MSKLFTITFTTQKRVKKFDARGKMVSETNLDTPVTLSALPLATAMSYSGCDNFKISDHVPTHTGGRMSGSSKPGWGNAATKKYTPRSDAQATPKQVVAGKSAQQKAATTGDLSAAINKA